MRLINKLACKLAKFGYGDLEYANPELKDSSEYINNVIKSKGIKEFKFANDWWRSDAEFILTLVEEYPDILEFALSDIRDRYISTEDPMILEDKPIDELVFAIMCYEKNSLSFAFVSDDVAKQMYAARKEGKTIKGNYHGKPFEYTFKVDEFELGWMEMLNPDLGDENIKEFASF